MGWARNFRAGTLWAPCRARVSLVGCRVGFSAQAEVAQLAMLIGSLDMAEPRLRGLPLWLLRQHGSAQVTETHSNISDLGLSQRRIGVPLCGA